MSFERGCGSHGLSHVGLFQLHLSRYQNTSY